MTHQCRTRCVAIVCRALGVRIKDMTGGELGVPDARLPVDQGPAIPDSNPTDHEISGSRVRRAGGRGRSCQPTRGKARPQRRDVELEHWIQSRRSSFSKKLVVRTRKSSRGSLAKRNPTVERLRALLQMTARTLFGGGSVYPEPWQSLGEYGAALGILTDHQMDLIQWLHGEAPAQPE
jgi:hypothetical protein